AGSARRARSVRTKPRRRHHHGPAAQDLAAAGCPVPPGIGPDVGRAPHAAQLHGRQVDVDAVLTDLLMKLTRHEDLTADEAASAMDLVMTGQATSAQLAAFLVGLSMKGERPEEIV